MLKTLSKYDNEETESKDLEAKLIKESIEFQKEKFKYRRINEDEPYEDGDNFDSHIGKYKYITNPYALLEKMETDFSSSSDE